MYVPHPFAILTIVLKKDRGTVWLGSNDWGVHTKITQVTGTAHRDAVLAWTEWVCHFKGTSPATQLWEGELRNGLVDVFVPLSPRNI